jgi:hypothetical protein
MNTSRYILTVLALSFIAAFPYKAYTADIPFAASYEPSDPPGTDPELTILCDGPWGRSSTRALIPVGATGQVFYTAKETIFSPYGNWACYTYQIPFRPPLVARATFILQRGQGPVRLTITKDSLFCTSRACGIESGQTITAQATLGDDNNNKRRERDTWSFQGTGAGILL